MPHGHHIYQKTHDTSMAKMCTYPPYQHALPHWKCVLNFCENCPRISITSQELDKNHSKTCPKIMFLYIKWYYAVKFMADAHLIKKYVVFYCVTT